jgi:hypothetical protein
MLEVACRGMASLESLALLCLARPAFPKDTPAVSALWVTDCHHYGNKENFACLLELRSPEAHDIGSKF